MDGVRNQRSETKDGDAQTVMVADDRGEMGGRNAHVVTLHTLVCSNERASEPPPSHRITKIGQSVQPETSSIRHQIHQRTLKIGHARTLEPTIQSNSRHSGSRRPARTEEQRNDSMTPTSKPTNRPSVANERTNKRTNERTIDRTND